MKLYRLEARQLIRAHIEAVWDFFSSPANLKIITPPYMGFDILSDVPAKMQPGLIIVYRVRPLFGRPVHWVTEITHVDELRFFVDEQRFGPYRFWHHRHVFLPTADGIEMTDLVHYSLPPPLLDSVVNAFLVAPRLLEIFAYRQKKIIELFQDAPPLRPPQIRVIG